MDNSFNGPVINGYGGIKFETAGTNERLRITSAGKVGMGLVDAGGTGCDPDGNHLLIRGASTFQTNKGHIMLTGDSATVGQGPQIVFSESGGGSNNAGAYIGHVRQGSNSIGDLVFGTRATSGDASTVPDERLRITSTGQMGMGVTPNWGNSAYNGLHVHSSGGTNAYVTLTNNATGSTSSSDGFSLAYSSNDINFLNRENGNMVFTTNGAERLRIPSTGGIELKTDGKGIQFPTPQTPSNSDGNRVGISSEMRYYETGTFVPGLSSTVLNSLQNPVFTDASYARRIGRYVRVGHLVFCTVSIKMASSITFATGAHTGIAPVSIVGVTPFRYSYAGRYAASGEPDYNPCNIWYNGSGLTDDTLYATMQRHFPGQTHIQITKPSSGGVQNHASTNYGEVFPADSHVVVSYTYAIDLDNADY